MYKKWYRVILFVGVSFFVVSVVLLTPSDVGFLRTRFRLSETTLSFRPSTTHTLSKHSSIFSPWLFQGAFSIAVLFSCVCYCNCAVLFCRCLFLVSSSFGGVFLCLRGWPGGAKVSCILCHRGVQLILAYSWARPAILVVGKGSGAMLLFHLFLPCSSFFPVPLSSLFISFISSTIFSISFLPFSWRRHKMTHKDWRVVKPQHNQSVNFCVL